MAETEVSLYGMTHQCSDPECHVPGFVATLRAMGHPEADEERKSTHATPSGPEDGGRDSIVPTDEERAAAREALVSLLCEVQGDLRGPKARRSVERIYRREIEILCERGWEDAESTALRERLATLLHQTANIIKGDPGPLRDHSWHDLPEAAAARLAAVEQRVADARAEERERIAAAIEDRASRASYTGPEEITDTYLDAARIAREARP